MYSCRNFLFNHHSRSIVELLWVIVLCLFFVPRQVVAHGDVHLLIKLITAQIEQSPTAELYLKRGDLYRLDESYREALADFEYAEKLNPSLDAIFMARGRTQYEARRFEHAVLAFDHLFKRKPDHPEGLLFRARSFTALGEHAAALRDYDHLVTVMPSPTPDCFLERAASLVALDRKKDGVRSLDEGIERLGNLTVLQQAAMQIEVNLKHYDAALVRTQHILDALQRKEVWLERRGDILSIAGRQTEAHAAYSEALASLLALPEQHRTTKPMLELEARLQTHLGAQAPDTPKLPNPINTISSP